MSGSTQRTLLIGVSVTWHFDGEDAAAIAYEMRGVPERHATRADLRSFMRNAIRRALAEARQGHGERSSGERPSLTKEEKSDEPIATSSERERVSQDGKLLRSRVREDLDLGARGDRLSRRVGDGKPVAFFDTETGSDYVLPLFRDAGIELLVVKSRAFADLVEFVSEAESKCSVAIVDSITHVWDELREAYEKKLGRTTGLEIWDWAPIKREWRQFTDAYLNSRIHMIVCGRAGDVYAREWNDEREK